MCYSRSTIPTFHLFLSFLFLFQSETINCSGRKSCHLFFVFNKNWCHFWTTSRLVVESCLDGKTFPHACFPIRRSVKPVDPTRPSRELRRQFWLRGADQVNKGIEIVKSVNKSLKNKRPTPTRSNSFWVGPLIRIQIGETIPYIVKRQTGCDCENRLTLENKKVKTLLLFLKTHDVCVYSYGHQRQCHRPHRRRLRDLRPTPAAQVRPGWEPQSAFAWG